MKIPPEPVVRLGARQQGYRPEDGFRGAVNLRTDEAFAVVHDAHGGYWVLYGDGRMERNELRQ